VPEFVRQTRKKPGLAGREWLQARVAAC